MSSICQEYILNSSFKWIQSLSDSKYLVLNAIVNLTDNIKNEAEIVQVRLAEKLRYEEKTIRRAVKEFCDLGIIEKKHITQDGYTVGIRIKLKQAFSNSRFRAALFKFFGRAPRYILNLGMLLGETVRTREEYKKKDIQVSSPPSYVYNSSPDMSGDLSLLDCIPQKKVGVVMKAEESAIRKSLSIEAALIERGEKESNIDTAKLMAFSEQCLEYASNNMRHVKPKMPFNYFLKLCYEWSKENNIEPDYKLADHVRGNDLLKPYRSSVRDSIKQQVAKRNETERAGQAKKASTYEDSIRERADVQRRVDEKSKAILDATIERKRAQWKPLTKEEKGKVDLTNPFMEMVIMAQIKALKKLEWESDEAKIIRQNLADWGIPL